MSKKYVFTVLAIGLLLVILLWGVMFAAVVAIVNLITAGSS